MKLKKSLAMIAKPQSLNWLCEIGYEWRIDFGREKVGLFVTGNERELFILPTGKAREVETPSRIGKAKSAFEAFSGFDVTRALEFSIPAGRASLKPIGRVTAIEYESDKWTGRSALYVHEYKSPVTLYADRIDPKRAAVFGLRSDRGRKLLSKRGLIA